MKCSPLLVISIFSQLAYAIPQDSACADPHSELHTQLIGLFSQKAANRYGHYWYETPSGQRVAVTAVYLACSDTCDYLWEDAIRVGVITKRLDGVGYEKELKDLAEIKRELALLCEDPASELHSQEVGLYSQKDADLHGYAEWRSSSGTVVRVTSVLAACRLKQYAYNWPDARYVGVVKDCVKGIPSHYSMRETITRFHPLPLEQP